MVFNKLHACIDQFMLYSETQLHEMKLMNYYFLLRNQVNVKSSLM